MTGPTPTTPAAQDDAAAERDPAVANLFRMSRTAGVGLQDYTAINATAVAGFVAGAISVAAVIFGDTRASLFVPLVAVVLCVVAMIQIRRSAGTQTGNWLAIGGLVLAFVFAGLHAAAWARTVAQESQWKKELNGVAQRFVAAAPNPADAYALFEERFQNQVKPDTFARILNTHMAKQIGGEPIKAARVNDIVVFEPDGAGDVLATTLVLFSGDAKSPSGEPLSSPVTAIFSKVAGQDWKIRNMAEWFGELSAKPGAAGQQPGQ